MTATNLTVGGEEVVVYESGSDMPRQLSPRPYLQARTIGGIPVTQLLAPDHAHHFGASAALPDVDGVSFWGGRTFVRGAGSTMLDNHGSQRVVRHEATGRSVSEELSWETPDGIPLLAERRSLSVAGSADGWTLAWRSTLAAVSHDVTFGSPQTNGRPGAFYGGLFWRTPFDAADLLTADGPGVGSAHGSASPWLAVVTDAATLIAWTPPGFPWFVRDEGYVGFCPAVAVDERRRLAVGEELTLELRVAVVDGRLTAESVERAAGGLAGLQTASADAAGPGQAS